MIGKLSETVTGGDVTSWLVIALLVGYFVYKEWPEFKKRISSGELKIQQEVENDRTIEERLDSIETDVKEVKEKLNRDYYRINNMELELRKTKERQSDEMEELEIIMRALMAVLQGLQEQGANGPTREAEKEIRAYLNRKAHDQEI